MVSGAFFGLVAVLYYVCFLLLLGLTLFIAFSGRRRVRRHSRLRRAFFGLSLSLLCWQLTLFLEDRTALPLAQLWLGRANFAAIVFAPYFALRFVQEVPAKAAVKKSTLAYFLLAATWLLAALERNRFDSTPMYARIANVGCLNKNVNRIASLGGLIPNGSRGSER